MARPFALTKKDSETFAFIVNQINANGYAPSVREMCEHFGITSTSTMHERLYRLKRHGLIERVGARAIKVNDPYA